MKLFIFPTPLIAHAELIPDPTAAPIVGVADVYTGPGGPRAGQSFELPPLPDQNGAQLSLTSPGRVPILLRAVLHLTPTPFLAADDFHLMLDTICPPPQPGPEPANDPLTLLEQLHVLGRFDLTTTVGCGSFIEAAVILLHNRFSPSYGYIRKNPGQNQYNGHAVDALMLIDTTPTAQPGIYDCVIDAAGPTARVAFNFAGSPDLALFYYPA